MTVSPRSRARVLVISALYQLDLLDKDLNTVIEEVRREVEETSESLYYLAKKDREPALEFFESLLRGTWEHRLDIDPLLQAKLQNWSWDRVGTVERAILRLGCFEIIHRPDIPKKVSLNEMVELSKSFCDDKSKEFVNGVLDAIAS